MSCWPLVNHEMQNIAVGVVWTRLLIKCLLISDCCWGEWLWFRMCFWFRLIPYVSVWTLHSHLNSSHSITHTSHAHTFTHKQTNKQPSCTIPHTLKWWPRRDSQDGQAFNMYFMSYVITDIYLSCFLLQFLSNVHAYFNYRPSEVNTASVLRGDYCSDLHIHCMLKNFIFHSPHAPCLMHALIYTFDLVFATCQTLDSHSLVWWIIIYPPVPIFGIFLPASPNISRLGCWASTNVLLYMLCLYPWVCHPTLAISGSHSSITRVT